MGTLRDRCLLSCDQMYDYLTKMQGLGNEDGMSVNEIVRYDVEPNGFVILYANNRIVDYTSLKLRINKMTFGPDKINIQFTDSIHRTATLQPEKIIVDMLTRYGKSGQALDNKKLKITLVSDMKWLITRTREYYEQYGDLIRIPADPEPIPDSEIKFPNGLVPSEEQKNAVRTVLNSNMSYIWGAPGTGKTQFVLSTSILALIKKGKRIGVFAPTNNAIEQVLRGVMAILEKEDPNGEILDKNKDILRVGNPSHEFLKEYPNLCEPKGAFKKIEDLKDTIGLLSDVLFEKKCEVIRDDFDAIFSILDKYGRKRNSSTYQAVWMESMPFWTEIKEVLESNETFASLTDNIDEVSFYDDIEDIYTIVYGRDRPGNDNRSYDGWTFEKLNKEIAKIETDMNGVMSKISFEKLENAKIIAMTPHTMMGRFAPPGGKGKSPVLKLDHIFIDEAAYSNVIQALPVFAYGVPVTLLGDHMQLPPVCEISENILQYAVKLFLRTSFDYEFDESEYDPEEVKYVTQDNLHFGFLWSIPAMNAERLLQGSPISLMEDYIDNNLKLEMTKRADLTSSFRFGPNLGAILDACIYHNGIHGIAKNPLEIICIDVDSSTQIRRYNRLEVDATVDYISNTNPPAGEFVVLTPYKEQMKKMWERRPDLRDDIMNVHRSQGREWDTVILSVTDGMSATSRHSGNAYNFTSTVTSKIGPTVINTAVSRAKKRLVLVCDKTFWTKTMRGEMIGLMAEQADSTIKYVKP